jgi:hypothetical protein
MSPAKAAINSDRVIAEELTGGLLPCQERSASHRVRFDQSLAMDEASTSLVCGNAVLPVLPGHKSDISASNSDRRWPSRLV